MTTQKTDKEENKTYEGHKKPEVVYAGQLHMVLDGPWDILKLDMLHQEEYLHDVLRRAVERGLVKIRFEDLEGGLGYRVVMINELLARQRQGLVYEIHNGLEEAPPTQYLFKRVRVGNLVFWSVDPQDRLR